MMVARSMLGIVAVAGVASLGVACLDSGDEQMRWSCLGAEDCAPGQACSGVHQVPEGVPGCPPAPEEERAAHLASGSCFYLYCVEEGASSCGTLACEAGELCVELDGMLGCAPERLRQAEQCECYGMEECVFAFELYDDGPERCIDATQVRRDRS